MSPQPSLNACDGYRKSATISSSTKDCVIHIYCHNITPGLSACQLVFASFVMDATTTSCKLDKPVRVKPVKVRKKRPYPFWLERYFVGGDWWRAQDIDNPNRESKRERHWRLYGRKE